MRKLSEIVDSCKNGEKPTIDEARLTICVLDDLLSFETMHLMHNVKSNSMWEEYKEHFNRFKSAFNQSPTDYLDDEYHPDNQGMQKRHNAVAELLYKIMDD